jgi:hypothetical protein
MGLLDYFSSGSKKVKNPKRKKRKLGYFSGKKEWKKRMDSADPFLEKKNDKKKD